MEQDKLLTTKELAAMLGISLRTVETYRTFYEKKIPPHITIGKRTIRYRLSTVVAWLAKQENAPRK